jgi:hypothetical protein
MRIEASLLGFGECRGTFRIIDENGRILDRVRVSYRVGDSGWIPCGQSLGRGRGMLNYIQPSMVYYRIGEPVVWRFCKPGYTEGTVIRYTADLDFDDKLDVVMLLRNEPMRLQALRLKELIQ